MTDDQPDKQDLPIRLSRGRQASPEGPRASFKKNGSNVESGQHAQTDIGTWVALLNSLPRDRARAIADGRSAIKSGRLDVSDRELAELIIRDN